MPEISTPDAILRINKVIENNEGDEGRLRYIAETLQKGKQLFHSDKIYLEKKISADVIPIQIKKSEESDEMIKDVKRLIALKFGEPGRLRYILQMLENKKQLYHSDEDYLYSKKKQFMELSEGRRLSPRFRSRVSSKPKTHEPEFYDPFSEKVEEKPAPQPVQDIPEKLQGIEDAVLSQEPKKTSDLFELIDDTPKVNVEIEKEREKVSKLKHKHEELKIQRDELSQLIAYRQEYEIKINREKEILEKEIKIEQEKVKEKDKLVEELIKNQSKIIQTKTEREVIVEQIRIDKEKSELELKKKQEELEKVKKEYEDLQKEIKTKRQFLDDQISKEEEKLDKLKKDSEEN